MNRNLTSALTTAAVGMMAGAAVYMLSDRSQPERCLCQAKHTASKALSGAGELMDGLGEKMTMR